MKYWLNVSEKESCSHETKMSVVDGVWKIEGRDLQFGRSPYRVFGTVEGKARYALVTYNSANIDEVLSILQEVYPELED